MKIRSNEKNNYNNHFYIFAILCRLSKFGERIGWIDFA